MILLDCIHRGYKNGTVCSLCPYACNQAYLNLNKKPKDFHRILDIHHLHHLTGDYQQAQLGPPQAALRLVEVADRK